MSSSVPCHARAALDALFFSRNSADYREALHQKRPGGPDRVRVPTQTSIASVVRGPEDDESAPLISQAVYDDIVVIHKMEGRPSLPMPLAIAQRMQLYLASACFDSVHADPQSKLNPTPSAIHCGRQSASRRDCSNLSVQQGMSEGLPQDRESYNSSSDLPNPTGTTL